MSRLHPLAVVAATAAGAALGVAVGLARAEPEELASQLFQVALAASFTAVGALVLARLPGHAVGRLCLAIGALWAVCATSITLGEVTHRAGWGGTADWLAWPGWLWIVAVGLIGTHLLLRLPDGRLPSPRWRRFARACTAAIVLGSIAMALTPAAEGSSVENPLGVDGAEALLVVALLLIAVCILGSIGEFVGRYRRGDPGTRLRMRLVAAGATSVVATDAVLVALLIGAVAMALTPAADGSSADNPLGLEGAEALLVVALLLIAACILGSIGEFVVRYRRGDPGTRLRMRLVAAGATAVVATDAVLVALLIGAVDDDSALGTALANVRILLYAVIPICIGVAILRHRLLGIDVAINRALVYGAVTALLLGTYVVLVLALQTAFGPVTDGNGLAVALSTLAAAALFQPVRRRVQGLVDRRFYRRKYDAEQTLARFALRLRVETDLEALRAELAAAVREAVQPAHVSVWLREDAR